jgi:hypothetical protein
VLIAGEHLIGGDPEFLSGFALRPAIVPHRLDMVQGSSVLSLKFLRSAC